MGIEKTARGIGYSFPTEYLPPMDTLKKQLAQPAPVKIGAAQMQKQD
jgi:hypothetical protein